MYRYKKVSGAADDADTRFDDGMALLKDDFDYLVETFEKMDRDGNRERAIELMSQLHQSVNSAISSAVEEVTE